MIAILFVCTSCMDNFVITHPTCTHIISIVSHFMRLCWSVQTGFSGVADLSQNYRIFMFCVFPPLQVFLTMPTGVLTPHVMFYLWFMMICLHVHAHIVRISISITYTRDRIISFFYLYVGRTGIHIYVLKLGMISPCNRYRIIVSPWEGSFKGS